jgi:hypothetical protein
MAESQGRPNSLEPLTRAVLRGAREIAVDGGMQPARFGELEAALGREHTIELVIVAAFYPPWCGFWPASPSMSNRTTSPISTISRCRPRPIDRP